MNVRIFALISLMTVLTGAFVWVRLQLVNISYEIHEHERQARVLKEECDTLTLKIDEARSPQRLERLAASKFKMKAPTADQVIVLE